MLPEDDRAIWPIIYRHCQDWEESFVLQYDGLPYWLINAREVLTRSEGLHTMSLEDLELQIRHILFILGQYATPNSSFIQTCYQRHHPPYRPFGVRASIALICYAFMGIQATAIEGYESKDLWLHDQDSLSTMVARLQKSPLMEAELSVPQLESMILSLQRAFQLEEVRVASTKPQKMCVREDSDLSEYYRRAFLSLNPMLLPKIFTSALGIEPMTGVRTDRLAYFLAQVFHKVYPIEGLESAFKKVPEILQSKPDRVVATEMFHVKAFEQACHLGHLGESSPAQGRRDTDVNDQRRRRISYFGVPCFSGEWSVSTFNVAPWSCTCRVVLRMIELIVLVSMAI